MKNTLLASISAVSLAIALNATAQDILWQTPKAEYIIPGDNDRINAFNFLNPAGSAFIYEDPNGLLPFNTYYTTNFVNRGTMIGLPGFDFSSYNPTNAFLDGQAANFVNAGGGAAGGVVECSSLFQILTVSGAAMPVSTGKILVSANEITNSGDFFGDSYSLVRLVGTDVDLSQGRIDLTQGLSLGGTNLFVSNVQPGWLDEYWGLGDGNTNIMVPAALFFNGAAVTPGLASQITATNRNFQTILAPIFETNATAFTTTWEFNPSNFLVQAVFLQEPNPAFTKTVGFDPFAGIFVQWQWSSTNIVTGVVDPNNFLTLNDDFGEVTNLQVVVDGVAGPNFTFKPFNYTFAFQPLPAGVFTTGPSTPSLPGFVVTNQSTSYEALFTPVPQLVTDIPEFGNATNLPGRIEIECANLRMSNTLMAASSYTLLKGTNHLFDYPGIGIASPFLDLYLRRTNGSFVVSNLVAAYINHLNGPVQLWSARWTNNINGVTNQFHVLFVNSSMSTVTPPAIQTLSLISTNASVANSPGAIVISDILNVTSNLTLNGRSLTITTNGPGFVPASGQLNLLNFDGLFPQETPNLLFLTNSGIITAGNSMDFAGLPFNPTSPDSPPAYAAFVNHGQITDLGSSIFAKYFEHSGIMSAELGSVTLQEGATGFITNGTILTTFGGISLGCDNLLISNSLFVADGAISLTSSNILSDGVPSLALLPLTNQLTAGVTNGNSWSSSGGLRLTVKPATGGDLLGTTITSTADTNRQVPIVWAGDDRGIGSYVDGNTTTGFFNNSAVGRLIFDGKSLSSRFNVSGPDTSKNYALYVDYLELRDWATNTDSKGNFTAFQFQPNMKIYFAQAVANGYSIAEKLAGLFATNPPNGGHFVWVSNYNYGYFSSTNITYPDGSVNRVNAALAQSPDLGTPFPPAPVWSPAGSNVPSFPDQPFFVTDVIELGVVTTNVAFSGTLVNFAFDLPANSGLTFSRSGSGAAWVNVAPDGTLSGTPTIDDVGTNNFTVIVTSASGLSATSTAFIAVTTNAPAGPADPPVRPVIDSPAVLADSSSTAAGAYYGLASDSSNGVSVASSGYVTINVTARSNYTAKLQLAGHTYSFSGSLKNGVSVSTSSGNSGPMLKLRLQQSGPDQIHGSVSNGSARWSADLVADRLVFNKVKNPANSANYTMIIPPQPNSANGPGGYGNGTVKVDASGKVQWAGTLADGTKVTQGTAISKDGYWPLYSSLYGSRGLVIGWMQITNEAGSDMNGTVAWIKPKGTVVKAYSGNFTNCVQASGMVYKTGARTSVLNLSDGSVTLTGGALGTNTVICPFTLDTRNHVGGTSKMKMLIKPGNGLITGSAVDAVHGKLSFQGVVLQGSTNGFGFFLNSGESGQVELSPAQ